MTLTADLVEHVALAIIAAVVTILTTRRTHAKVAAVKQGVDTLAAEAQSGPQEGRTSTPPPS